MVDDKQVRVKEYNRRKLWLSLVGLGLQAAYFALWIPLAHRFIAWAEGETDNRWLLLGGLAVAVFAVYELLTLPLNYYDEYILEHRFGLSDQTRSRWLLQTAKEWLVGGVLGGILLALFYANFWYLGPLWWLWLWIGLFVVSVVLAQLFPTVILPIFHKTERLEDEALAGRLRQLAQGTGVDVEGVYRLVLRQDTKKANAMLAGLGRTRRVLLADTLLAEFAPSEIDVVFAHELGHHVHRHIPKLLALNTVVSMLPVAAFWLLLRGAGVAESIAALPAICLVSTAIALVLRPAANYISRRMETQCDAYALRRTGDAAAYRSAFGKLAAQNLSDPYPHPVIEWFFYDHPPIGKRLALADGAITAPRLD